MKKIFLPFFLVLTLNASLETFAQFPLQVDNRWDYTDCWWNPTGGSGCDTVRYFAVSDTLLPNGKKYYLISPKNYYFFMDFMRADSSGIYYYDTLCDREWLYFNYNLPIGEYMRVGVWGNCDTSYSPKVYKTLDTSTVFWGDTLRFMRFSFVAGLDNDWSVDIIPEFGFVSWDQGGFFANYNMNLKGCILSGIVYGTLTSIKDDKTFPNEFSLSQNYPNPFNPSTKIKYTVGTPPSSSPLLKGRNEVGFVSLKVYDILGNEVAKLINEEKPAGNYEVELNASHLSSGIYFVKLQIGDFTKTNKMVHIK